MIYINGRFLTQKVTGVQRFAIEICRALQAEDIDFVLLVPNRGEIENDYNLPIQRVGRFSSHFWEQISLPLFLKGKRSLLIHLTSLGCLFYSNQIITIHDASFFHNPRWFSLTYRWYYRLMTPIVARKAKKVFTVSLFSKSEILKYISIDANKIKVVYNAVSEKIISNNTVNVSDSVKKMTEKPYILAVSSIDPRKNYDRLIHAFSQEDLINKYQLLLVGGQASHFLASLPNTRKKNICFLGYVSDDDLRFLYENATLFVYPSLYEGFGIPPLEAMSLNCPVAVSDIPSLKEICQDAAFYFNPLSIDSIFFAIQKLINEPKLREELTIRGKKRSSFFSWENSAKQIIEIIK